MSEFVSEFFKEFSLLSLLGETSVAKELMRVEGEDAPLGSTPFLVTSISQ